VLRTRILSAVIFGPIAIAMIWAGGWWLFAGTLLVAEVAGYELGQLMRRGGYLPLTWLILALIATAVVGAQFPALGLVVPAVTWLLILSLSWQLFQAQDPAPATNWALSMAGGLYVGLLAAHLILIRALPAGLAWTVLALTLTWGGDTAAYFLGRAIGRHKLSLRLSPGKTWEGFFAGLVACLLIGALVGYLALRQAGAIGPVHGLAVGLVTGVLGVFGDLAVSMIKRQVKAKDSSNIIPGHGGVLDRMDSLLFNIVATYYYAVWIVG
jgi:phosphatidate cytidylyltransferase